MKKVTLTDTPPGNALGWNPDGFANFFTISEPAVIDNGDTNFVSISTSSPSGSAELCGVTEFNPGNFELYCGGSSFLPQEGDILHYVVGNLPAHVVN